MSSFITCVDRCSSVLNASIFLMNESILFPLSNPTNEADSTEFHFAHRLVIVTGLLSSCVCCSPFISLQVREKWSAQRTSLVIGSNGNTSNSKIYGNRVGDKSHNQPQKYLCKFYYPEACQDPTSHLQYKCHTTDKALIVLIDA